MVESGADVPMTEGGANGKSVAIVLNRDLMFGSRIRSALAQLGLAPRFARDTEQFVSALAAHHEIGAIGIIDMNGPVAWDALAAALRDDASDIPTLAFGPHVDAAGRRAAKAAGVSRIVSNGQFASDTIGLIDRYRRR